MGRIRSVFEEPVNGGTKIWRYCDVTKLFSLVDRKALFFSRIDKLEDRFEGSFPKTNISIRAEEYGKYFAENADTMSKFHSYAFEQIRKLCLVNCWCASEYEIAAMWKFHINGAHGIAIQSTIDRFKNSFTDVLDDDIFVGNVRYIDFQSERINEGRLLDRFFCKRRSFGFECEFRAVILRFQESLQQGVINFDRPPYEHGKYIEVDLDRLIEAVFVSPSAPTWFVELVQSVIERYGLKKNVKQSDLDDDPVF
ncbi:MAG: hypothetical protein DKINENOH_00684 [bacterium]|nr:hypothetical protein [bacterium]MCK6562780.1 hypothetical protein [bacterium]NUM69083.1 hypothetical protein [candidate division KSB1 bacterium]